MSYIKAIRSSDEGEPIYFKTSKWEFLPPILLLGVGIIFDWFFVIGAVALLYVFFSRLKLEYAATNKRITSKEGVFVTKVQDVWSNSIDRVVVQQGILGNILDYADLILISKNGESKIHYKRLINFRYTQMQLESICSVKKPPEEL